MDFYLHPLTSLTPLVGLLNVKTLMTSSLHVSFTFFSFEYCCSSLYQYPQSKQILGVFFLRKASLSNVEEWNAVVDGGRGGMHGGVS